jgi:hypothetical protein
MCFLVACKKWQKVTTSIFLYKDFAQSNFLPLFGNPNSLQTRLVVMLAAICLKN